MPDFIHKFEPADGNDTTLLLLHGTGGDENDLLGLGRAISDDAALLSMRGKVLEHGMPRFFRRLSEGVFDEADLIFRAGEFADFVFTAAARYNLKPEKIIAVGFSNGANIAAATMLLHPKALRGAILIRSMVPLVPEKQPDLSGKSVLMLSGTHDPIVPRDNAEQLARMFKDAGADLRLQWQDASHGIVMEDVNVARLWLSQL